MNKHQILQQELYNFECCENYKRARLIVMSHKTWLNLIELKTDDRSLIILTDLQPKYQGIEVFRTNDIEDDLFKIG